ncbi:MAG: 4-(cytidine 5'-diphospho)-2-C-methyl-D-erythritol kinase [Daejeonella sp.]
MILFPNAKINIGLNIINKRADGFHNLETVFYPVMVRDVLEVVESKELSFTSSGSAVPGNPDDNLCLKSYHLLSQDIKLPPVHIHLHKNIPIGAGLGGGSSDASFLIRLMNEKFDLGLSIEEMENYASRVGSDCAFFIKNIPVYASERGDKLAKIELNLSQYYIILVMPPIRVATSDAFKKIIPAPSSSLKELIEAPVESWKYSIENDFESPVFSKNPEIKAIKDSLDDAGALYASMSGSGSSVYGIFESPLKLPELEVGNKVFYGV